MGPFCKLGFFFVWVKLKNGENVGREVKLRCAVVVGRRSIFFINSKESFGCAFSTLLLRFFLLGRNRLNGNYSNIENDICFPCQFIT